jgi:hypothetical protein
MIEVMYRTFHDVHVFNDPHSNQFGSGDWTAVITRAAETLDDLAQRQSGGPNWKTVQPDPRDDCQVGLWLVQTERGYVYRSEHVCYQVQLSPLLLDE